MVPPSITRYISRVVKYSKKSFHHLIMISMYICKKLKLYFLSCLGLLSKDHRENEISCIFLKSSCQVGMNYDVKYWNDFLFHHCRNMPWIGWLLIQAFLDFRGFDFRDFWFTAVYNSILFSSPLALLSNLNLRGFCFCSFIFVSPH